MFSLVGSHKFWWFTNLILFLTCLFIKRRNFFFTGWRLGESKRCGSKDCTEWDILSSYIQILARRRIIHAIIKSRKPPWDLEMYNNYFLLFFNLSATCSDHYISLLYDCIIQSSARILQNLFNCSRFCNFKYLPFLSAHGCQLLVGEAVARCRFCDGMPF